MADLVIRNTSVGDIAIEDGYIAAIGEELPGAQHEIDALGLTCLPGLIDVHVHFNEPGRTDWEGAATGSGAFAAGGGTLFFDMPLNSSPCTVTGQAFDEKRAALERTSITDFGLWGGIVPANLGDLPELAERGVVGFKAFLCDSGLPEFPRSDDLTLYEGMREAARLGLPVAVHAESEEITRGLTQRMIAEGRCDIPGFLESRPVIAEVEAIDRACCFARETGCRLHIVHISSGRGVAAALEGRELGADVSIETCPHYLFFTSKNLERIGALAKCAPPLRSRSDQEALWEFLLSGQIDIVSSDHSPCPPEMKQRDSFFQIWGGIAGVQSTLHVLLERAPIDRIVELTSRNPAHRFGVPRRGAIQLGNYADLILVDLNAHEVLTEDVLHQRHRASPYVGHTFPGVVRTTFRRGELIYSDGAIMARGGGRFVRPAR